MKRRRRKKSNKGLPKVCADPFDFSVKRELKAINKLNNYREINTEIKDL